MATFIGASWSTLGWTVVVTVAIYLAVIVATRIAGLRSFAKMSSFDFAATVAIGSVLATTAVSSSVSLAQGAVALATIYAAQWSVARLRRSRQVERFVDNTPRLLMAGSDVIEENLRAGRVTHADLRGKLREANVLNLDHVRAVVLEATGDISVLHSDDPDERFDTTLLDGVIGAERLN